MKHWHIEQIAWDRFDPSKVESEVIPLVKSAAMVERNGDDYAIWRRASSASSQHTWPRASSRCRT